MPGRAAFDCVVLDFDGTFTDIDVEVADFVERYARLVSDVLGDEAGGAWEAARAEAESRAPEFGWTFDGHVVAPADADPYILASCTAQALFERSGVLRTAWLRSEVTSAIYRDCYKHTRTAFRPEAKEVLEALVDTGAAIWFVTNANTDVAKRKLDELAPRGRERIGLVGDAMKYKVCAPKEPDSRFDAIPEKLAIDGLQRPVLPQRGKYFDALARIWRETGASAQSTIVCGDIAELDLALPALLGAAIHLIERPTTHAYERAIAGLAGARCGSSEGLRELVERVRAG